MKNNVYLATKLYSFFDRYVSVVMFNSLLNTKRFQNDNIYLPFKDSNLKVSNEGNVAYNIFKADIRSLNRTDIFISRIDGPAFDAGVGFEIGYCLAKRIPIYIFNCDFFSNKLSDNHLYNMTPILNEIANIYKYEYINNQTLSYSDELLFNINEFSEFVSKKLDDSNNKIYEGLDFNAKYDVFIDFCGLKYEWNRIIIDIIKNVFDKYNIKYYISNRYNEDFKVEKELSNLKNSKIYLTCYDENEPDLDSTILQGYAFFHNLKIIGYESNPVKYFVKDKQEFGVTLMLEQSCDKIFKKIDDVINEIVNIYK